VQTAGGLVVLVIATVITTRATNKTTIITTAIATAMKITTTTTMQREIHGAMSTKESQNPKRESQMPSKIIEKEGMEMEVQVEVQMA